MEPEKAYFKKTLESLNETQKQSVLSNATTLQILAGPGSGKTRVLTARVAYFILEKNIKPGHTIVVTFTNKAANEMKERLKLLIGKKNTEYLLIGTFHTLCARILRRFAKIVDLEPNFTIADTQASQEIITRLRADPNLPIDHFTRKEQKVGAIWGLISKAKSQGLTAAQYSDLYGTEFKKKDIAILFTAYESELKKLNLVDFDNLLIKGCELFRKKKDVLSNVKAILVDEYQDTNVVQYDLIKLMMEQKNEKTVTIVGDPDQSIFGWRSAEPKNFNKMQEDYKGTTAINMEQNYRSTATVLKSALHVITQDRSRIDKALYTNNPEGVPIAIIRTRNEESQAKLVAKEIKQIITYSKGLINYKDIAVLMRMNFISQQFERVFRSHNIPFSIVGGDRFFDRVEIKDITCYLRFAYNPNDYVSFNRIVNVPRRGVGEVTLKKIVSFSAQENISLLESLQKIVDGKAKSIVSANVSRKLKSLVDVSIEAKRLMNEGEEVSEIIHYIVNAIKYEDYLKEHHFQDHVARWSNIGELISIAKKQPAIEDDEAIDATLNDDPEGQSNGVTVIELEEEPNDIEELDLTIVECEDDMDGEQPQSQYQPQSQPQPQTQSQSDYYNEEEDMGVVSSDPVADFLEYCALCSNQKELEEAEGGKVTIATLHSSKGLEWPCVFIATCSEGVIPLSRAEDPNEEGRLLYVGMTRSKFLLYCISPEERTSWGNYHVEEISRYLRGLDRKLYTTNAPDWNDIVRTMLATTINKPTPSPDSQLVTTNNKKKTPFASSSTSTNDSMGFEFKHKFGGFTSASSMFRPGSKRFKSTK
ncbi:P-loop containing nucleoside triphosphate hydrolase protein [Gilbertella persicaria]|uniref:P-loop containing nucleoside triphosphate hydrolase protein n=1 Tax=Gilbertella persicaria TaxID=101096 RepID=UPI00221F3465|nr:P-loop containing nucleoside triphosphate hydrolase protein [Gilbertella persicaria]KAI8065345.1 P-loop containing nucleoside triphosphate hydrolase protein [Gilbertella persicaria]